MPKFSIDLTNEEEHIINSVQRIHGLTTKADVIHFALREVVFAEISERTPALSTAAPKRGLIG